ncbi:MAG: hypothetical protein SVY10_19400, partial [Thermodesulfobacteriota bacterium]|nr:hypothetical protein [Thermodesulfobacteriota bacterium]
MVSEVDNGTYIAKFNRQDLVNVTSGDATLTVTGELYDGAHQEKALKLFNVLSSLKRDREALCQS